MQIGISNMSWEKEKNLEFIPIIKDAGFQYIESVYSKLDESFPVRAIQSIFYDSNIKNFSESFEYMEKLILDCCLKGIEIVTFGCPSMRVGDKNKINIFLQIVDEIIADNNITFCIEPNSKYYGAEYYNTLEEISADLSKYKNISGMIDVGNSILESKNPIEEFDSYKKYVKHIHFAAKDLVQISDYKIYNEFYNHLLKNKYDGLITYEFAKFENFKDTVYNFTNNIGAR